MSAPPRLIPSQRHLVMLRAYGACAGRTCGECQFLVAKPTTVGGSMAYVCRVYRKDHFTQTTSHHGQSIRWGQRWAACGRFKAVE